MRLHSLDDVDKVFAFYKAHEEAINRGLPASQPKVRAGLVQCMVDSKNWFFEYVEHEGNVVGFIVAVAHDTIMTAGKQVSDIAVYLDEKHKRRCIREFYEMWKRFEEWAKGTGAERIQLSTYGGYVDMAKKYGYEEHATVLYKRLTNG